MISIRAIQGSGLESPYSGQTVTTQGVVTGNVRRGFFIQTPDKVWDGHGSDGVFVYSPDKTAMIGSLVEVVAEVVDFLKDDDAKPVTQLHASSFSVLDHDGGDITPIEFDADILSGAYQDLARYLNSLEGMLVKVGKGSTFIAPSNHYGDYVLCPPGLLPNKDLVETEHHGLIPRSGNEQRWFPGFRVNKYSLAKRLNVGAKLESDVIGPLNYRVGSYQMAVGHGFRIEPSYVKLNQTQLAKEPGHITVMTLNCFNLDAHVEHSGRVTNPRLDVDDDWGDGRFHTLAQAIALQAKCPDIVALQEIQDNDGAELSTTTDADETYQLLIRTIRQISDVEYQWVDIAPLQGEDGGQPGGNIRNGFLYNPKRVQLVKSSVRNLGRRKTCFEDSRKPLICEFTEVGSDKKLAVINVHLASKRHQNSIFAPVDPGVDKKLQTRVEQSQVIHREMDALEKLDIDYYVTGDFNDGEHSEPMQALVGKTGHNLVMDLAENQRYDYNHRGKLQVLMHGVVSKSMHQANRAQYEILHGNELIGVPPGEDTDKPSDHAYVIAKLSM